MVRLLEKFWGARNRGVDTSRLGEPSESSSANAAIVKEDSCALNDYIHLPDRLQGRRLPKSRKRRPAQVQRFVRR